MKTVLVGALCLTLATVLGACMESNDMHGMHMDHQGGSAAGAKTYPVGAVDLKNTKCVVTGDTVGDSPLTEVYEGKIYHFCCPSCPLEFTNDPAKFAKLVAADPAKYGIVK